MVKRVRQCEWGVVVASVFVRLAALRSFGDDPASAHPVVDAHTYWSQAQALMEGKDPFVNGYYQPPAYPWMLAQWGRLNGGEIALVDVRLLQLIMGVLTTAAIVYLAGQIGRRRGFVWAGVLAGQAVKRHEANIMPVHGIVFPGISEPCKKKHVCPVSINLVSRSLFVRRPFLFSTFAALFEFSVCIFIFDASTG